MSTKKLTALSLFSGAGGLDHGLERSGFIEIAGCVEMDVDSCNTLAENMGEMTKVINADISEITVKEVLEQIGCNRDDIDLIVGGPPCQAFSVFGKRRGLDDKRGAVSVDFVRFVSEIRPKYFLMENVRGLMSMKLDGKKGGIYTMLVNKFNQEGYCVDVFVVNSVNYGAPEIRERVLIVGNRLDYKCHFPEPSHSDSPTESQKPFLTLGDAIRNVDFEDQGCMDFSERKKRYLAMIPQGGNWRSLPEDIQKESMGKSWYLKGGRSAYWRRLSWDFPSPTVTTMPNHAGTSMCHPEETRALNVSELASIQGFPDDWKFKGKSNTTKCRQIGNAVPVILGEVAGSAIYEMHKNANQHKGRKLHREIHIRPHVRTRQYYKKGKVFNDSTYLSKQNKKVDVRS